MQKHTIDKITHAAIVIVPSGLSN